MKTLLTLILFVSVLTSCNTSEIRPDKSKCTTEATVRDLTGLDGCGFVFELNDGTRLEPVRLFFCGTPPLPKEVTEDALYNFQFIDGKKVMIGYEELTGYASICMAGKTVKITCLEELKAVAFEK